MRSFLFIAVCSALCMFCVDSPPAVAQSNFLWIADMEEGSLADWYFPETSDIGDSGGGIFPSGKYSYFASIMEGRGTHSLAATIWTPSTILNETSGVRAFRWKEPRENRELYFSAWFLLPDPTKLTADPDFGQFWDLVQFKSTPNGATGDSSDPFWFFGPSYGNDKVLRVSASWSSTTEAGPSAKHSVGRKFFHQTIKSIPFGKWVHFEVFLKQSNAFDGHVIFWQDGVKLFDFNNVKTSYFNSAYNAWKCENSWSVNNYSDGISPNPYTLYIDDAAISTTRTAGVPTPPCNLIATSVSCDQINLAWTSSLYAATGYKIERKKSGGDWNEVAKLPAIATTYSNTGLTEDTSYSYRVRAFNEITNSAFSNTTSAETQREDFKNFRGNLRSFKNRFRR